MGDILDIDASDVAQSRSSDQITPEYPDSGQLEAYGALSFLYMRAPKYDRLAFQDMRRLIQPPIDLRFFHIHKVEGVPRAAITWGYLAPEVEANIAHGRGFAPSDWASGPQAWIMELIAPYKSGNFGRMLTKAYLASLKPEHMTARFARFASPGHLKHVTEFRRGADNHWSSHRISGDDFKQQLAQRGFE